MKLIGESASVENSMGGSALSVGDECAKSADALQQALAINVSTMQRRNQMGIVVWGLVLMLSGWGLRLASSPASEGLANGAP